jgi:hypothetical protein
VKSRLHTHASVVPHGLKRRVALLCIRVARHEDTANLPHQLKDLKRAECPRDCQKALCSGLYVFKQARSMVKNAVKHKISERKNEKDQVQI